MNEKAPTLGSRIEGVAPEGKKYVVKGEVYVTNSEQEEKGIAYALEHPIATVSPEMPEECAEKVASLERLFSDFEQNHDMDALLAIDRMTVEEAKAHVARQAARDDVPAIVALLNYAESQKRVGVVSEAVWEGLYAKYCAIQRAIGTLNGEFLDHSKP